MARLLLIIAVALVLFGASYAASCSSRSYSEACGRCSFDESGKMDRNCWANSEADARTCLAISYPRTAVAYRDGKCPQVDRCVADLEICKLANGGASDKVNCGNAEYKACFTVADSCAKTAAYACSKEDDNTIFDIPRICAGGGPAFILLGALALGALRKAPGV